MRWLVVAAAAFVIFLAAWPAAAGAYTVQPGDTLWGISRRTGTSVDRLVQANHIQNPSRIYPGQELVIPTEAPSAPAVAAPEPPVRGAQARAILTAAARAHGLRRSFVLAVSYWESGWNNGLVSRDGAVGMMQIMPATGATAGPWLLGRQVDLRSAHDNAELGAALLRRYLEEFDDPKLALAAYYQGAGATRRYGIYPSSRSYVDGIWALRNRFEANPPD